MKAMASKKDIAKEYEANSISKIENLIVDNDAHSFQEIERLVDVFCPFEAIGMVRQEIKHASFLSYILDPNRPHSFGTKLLEKFLAILTLEENSTLVDFSRLDLHFMDLSNASVRREWKRIDLLIELPKSLNMKRGIVVAIELKIDASESESQLSKYKETIESEFSKDDWEHVFVFLTAKEDGPSKGNETWIPLGLSQIIDGFEEVVKVGKMRDPSAELFESYVAMLRRHILANEKLEELVHKVWNKHKEALEILIAHRPDEGGDIFKLIHEKRGSIAERFSSETDFNIKLDTCDRSNFHFVVENWINEFDEMKSGDGTWLDSNSILSIVLKRWNGFNFTLYFYIGPGDASSREELYLAIKNQKKISFTRHKTIPKKWKALSHRRLLTEKMYCDWRDDDKGDDQIVDEMIKTAVIFLKEELPYYDNAVRVAFAKT